VRRLLAAVASLLLAGATSAEDLPLWEFGMGGGVLTFPDYRGSDESRLYPVPAPYFVYRGKFLKADRDGMRGSIFNNEVAELDISLNATIPVDSDENSARRGMQDLKPTLEIGPSLNVHLWESSDERIKLDLVLPLRAPLTVESSPRLIGWVFMPRIGVRVDDPAGFEGWRFGVGAGPGYADQKFHDYYYSVAPRFATPTRPAHEADGGYSGAHVLASLAKKYPKFWIGGFIRYDVLDGAAFEDSPLMRTNRYFAGGIAFAWMLKESKRTVPADE
jgi:outer membrane protein